MFGRPGVEAAMIREALGRFPLAGMACSGEICGARLYGYTGVLAIFP
jgi:small ligand-binding sensory domain FIST